MIKAITNYQKLILLLAITSNNIVSYANFNINNEFQSNITFPDINNSQVFGILPNKLLFYSGINNGKFINGYYKDSDFLGWVNNKFQPLERYNSFESKKIESVLQDPDKNTVVLSTVQDIGQLISVSHNGSEWNTKKISNPTKFDTLVTTTDNKQILIYGKKELLYFSTNNSENWYQWPLPSGCHDNSYCSFENHYFNKSKNNYFLIQSTMTNDIRTNKLYSTTDQEYWSIKDVPFADSKIIKTFDGKFNTVFVQASDISGENKLWLTVTLEDWVDFSLPNGTQVADILVYNKNHIEILFNYETSDINTDITTDITTKTDLVILDVDTKTFKTLQTFNGLVSNIRLINNNTYLSGRFKNINNDNFSILASTDLS